MPKIVKHKLRLKLRAGGAIYWPIFTLVAVSLVLAFLNYQPGTWLTGWDNLHPEFNFPLNIKRSIFAVWQEYQGLGLLGGMAHSADLPRQIILYLFNLLGLPAQNLRYLWTFSMLILGPLGTYFFIKNFILKSKFDKATKQLAALLGSLFYLLNLSTVQNFFVPFETFTSFYGFFPWLLLVTVNYLHYPNRRNYFYLILLYLLASPSFYVETIFIVLILALLPLFISHAKSQNSYKAITAIFITQAFWLLPLIFFVLTNGHIGEQAKINLISTPETYLRNLEFANLKSVSLLKGFWFNFLDLASNRQFNYLLLPWREHLQNPLISLVGYLNFTLILTGIYYAFKKKIKLAPAIFSITAICLFFLLGGGLLINHKIPFITELFRSPFSKFSTPLSFTYAVFFSIGSIFLLDLFSFLHAKLTYFFTLFSLSLGLLIFAAPAFSGQLISPSMRLSIPQEYFATFEFFKNQDPAGRIANFPQYTFWGWNYYSWGYRGSGFLWYGIKQPILDRAFDVWEKQNQNYYREISTALYSKNQKEFENLINKYAINWILIDKFIIPPQDNQALYNRELINILNASDHFKLEKNINNNILIYKSDTNKRITNFLSVANNPSSTEPVLSIPSYTQAENLVPVEISYKKLLNQILLKFSPLLPSVNSVIPKPTPNYITLNIPSFYSSLILGINNDFSELLLPGELTTQTDFYPLTSLYLPTKDLINLSVYNNTPSQSIDVTNAIKDAVPYQCYTDKKDRQIEKIVFQNSVSLLGTDVVGCLSLPLPSFIPPGLISVRYSYFSPTQTPANTNITTQNLSFSDTPSQPLISKSKPFTTRQFSPLTLERQQLNLILEANNTKSVQEITYQDITANFHSLLASTTFTLKKGPSPRGPSPFNLPLINSSLNISQTPLNNQLLPQVYNCNRFRPNGKFSKTVTNKTIEYFAQNATACDSLDLRHLPHSTAYAITIDYQNIKGLPPTVCLENHSTGRCDVFERLFANQQPLIQTIVNPTEPPGYTLHIFNQSIGNRPTVNQIKSISISPYPLNFLKGFSSDGSDRLSGIAPSDHSSDVEPVIKSTHPAEFLYTVSLWSPAPDAGSILSLHQTYSTYWIALAKDASKKGQILKGAATAAGPLGQRAEGGSDLNGPINSSWHNSWIVPPGNHNLIIVYLPQLLEFLGFILLLVLLPIILSL